MSGSRIEGNIVYGMYSGLALLMDVHRPETANGFGVLFVGGSGWTASLAWDESGLKDKELQKRDWLPPLLDAGYTVFSVNHRALPRFPYPAALEDVQRALRFVRCHARDYGIHGDRIGGLGGSSGAHLLSLTAMLGDRGSRDDPDPARREDATLQCLVLRAPPSDLRGMALAGDKEGSSYALAFLDSHEAEAPRNGAFYAAASPINHVSPAAPPTLLIHGDADTIVPYSLSVEMDRALRRAGVLSRLLTIPGGLHGPDFGAEGQPRPAWPDYLGETVAWLDEQLRRPRQGP